MNQCNEPDHGAINAERAESRGLLKRSDAAEIISTHPNDLLGWPKGRRTGKVPKAKMQELERDLTAVTEQRDRLAEVIKAATVLIAAKGRHNTMLAYQGLREALAAVKGGSDE
jgi:hypothetical protein